MVSPQVEDLQYTIYDIKKQNLEIQSENRLLKVKVRKLQDEVNRKTKQLDNLLDPKKVCNTRKLMSQHGATMIMALKDENVKLQKQLADRDLIIRRLIHDLKAAKLYVAEKSRIMSPSLRLLESEEVSLKIDELSDGATFRSPTRTQKLQGRRSRSVVTSIKRTRSISLEKKESKSTTDLDETYIGMINRNLQKIKECGKLKAEKTKDYSSCSLHFSNFESPISHSMKDDLHCETPHVEIQQLQSYFITVLNEVDHLKSTISHLEEEQKKTSLVLEDKNTNIVKLASEIETLKNASPAYQSNDHRTTKCVSKCNSTTGLKGSTNGSSSNVSMTEEVESEDSEVSDEVMTAEETQLKDVDTNQCFEQKSVSIQTTRSFCSPPHIFTTNDSDECNIVQSTGPSIEYEDGIEVEYIK